MAHDDRNNDDNDGGPCELSDKNVYRGGDAVSAWVYTGLRGMGFSLSGIAWLAVPIAAIWAGVAYALGIRQAQIAASADSDKIALKGG